MNRSFAAIRVTWLAVAITWVVVTVAVLVDPRVAGELLVPPWGLDGIAVALFIAAIAILVVLEVNLFSRYKKKPTGSMKMLLLTFPAFTGALGVSLLLEFAFFNDFFGAYMNRTIFVFVVLGLFNWFLFIMEVFDGGLQHPFDGSGLDHGQYRRNWAGFALLVGLMSTFMVFLIKSIWGNLTPVENVLQLAPVLVIALFDLFSLLVKPLKIWRVAASRKERIGLLALFSSGLVLLLFLASFIIHTFAVSDMDPIDAYIARGVFYYLSMACLPAFAFLNWLGLIYPVAGTK